MLRGPVDGRAYARLLKQCDSTQSDGILDTVWPMPYMGDTAFFKWRYEGSKAFISDLMPLSSILGITAHKEELRGAEVHLTPRPSTVRWGRNDDNEHYAGLLGSYAFLTRVDEPLAMLREKQVYHTSYVGAVGDKYVTDKYRPYPDGRLVNDPAPVRARQLYRTAADGAIATGVNDRGFLTFAEYTSPAQPLYPFEQANSDAFEDAQLMVKYFQSGGRYDRYRGYWHTWYEDVTDASTHVGNSWQVNISYLYKMGYYDWVWGDRYFAHYRVNIRFDCGFTPSFGSNLAFEANTIPSDVFWLRDDSSVTVAAESFYGGSSADHSATLGITPPSSIVSLYSDIYQVTDDFEGNFRSFREAGSRSDQHRHHIVQENVNLRMIDLRPSHFLAASDALTTNIEALKTNELQNLQHLPAILDLLPDLGAIVRLATKALDGDPSAIIDLIDFLTEEILKWRFQRQPADRSVRELADTDVNKVLSSLSQSKASTIQGKFRYTFSDSENFMVDGILKLETHAKIRVRSDISTLMAGILTANAVGLLPTLSRIWALLPFSFVVDWFTNMSKRLKLVDNQLLYTTYGISWCLYSYKIVWYPSDTLLDHYGLVSYDSANRFGISVYQREFTHWMPRLTESRFDFMRPTRGPDPVTVGALLWQLLR